MAPDSESALDPQLSQATFPSAVGMSQCQEESAEEFLCSCKLRLSQARKQHRARSAAKKAKEVEVEDELARFSKLSSTSLQQYFMNTEAASAINVPFPCPAVAFSLTPSCLAKAVKEAASSMHSLSEQWSRRHAGIAAPVAAQQLPRPKPQLCHIYGVCLCRGEGPWVRKMMLKSVAMMKPCFPRDSVARELLEAGRIVVAWSAQHQEPSRGDGRRVTDDAVLPSTKYCLVSLQYFSPWRPTWLQMSLLSSSEDGGSLQLQVERGSSQHPMPLMSHAELCASLDASLQWSVNFFALRSTDEAIPSVCRFHASRADNEDSLPPRQVLWRGKQHEKAPHRGGPAHAHQNLFDDDQVVAAEAVAEPERAEHEEDDDLLLGADMDIEVESDASSSSSSTSSSTSRSTSSSASSSSSSSSTSPASERHSGQEAPADVAVQEAIPDRRQAVSSQCKNACL